MKKIALVALAFVLSPVLGAAQDAPPAGPPPPGGPDAMGTPNPQRLAAMEQVRAQLTQLRTQTRTQMLAALTPLHRSQLATLVGQVAISPNPDPRVVEQRIDALLSRGEAQSVVNIAGSERVNARNLMESARAQFEATKSPEEQAKDKERESRFAARAAHRGTQAMTPDPGRELLHTMLGFGGEREMHGGGPGGMMGGPHP